MSRTKLVGLLVLGVALGGGISGYVFSQDPPQAERRSKLQQEFNDGNFKDAYQGYRELALDPATDPKQVGGDLKMGARCLAQLGRLEELDAFVEAAVEVHAENWRLLEAAAETYMETQHFGYIVAGEFLRGNRRGDGKMVNSVERDRTRALELMQDALGKQQDDADTKARAAFHLTLAEVLLNNRGHHEAWRLQYKTDLGELPDYDDGWYYGRGQTFAPVDEEGNPIFYGVGESFAKAENDGQRWRWALVRARELDPSRRNEVLWRRAEFLRNQFGVETMRQYAWFFGRMAPEEKKEGEAASEYALHTLGEGETMAKLATGVKRFDLPEEHNFVRLYQQIADEPETGHGEDALTALAGVFENRRQYPKAADYWRRNIEEYGPGNNKWKEQRLEQIVGKWGRFEGVGVQPAGKGATVEFRFRNAEHARFEAKAVKVEALLEDVKAYLKSNPGQIDWNQINIGNIGYRLVRQNQTKYVGEQVATWEQDLKPAADHFDKQFTVATPLREAGAYLLTAELEDGNTSRIILWVADTAIVKKNLEGKTLYFVADARSGEPIGHANLEFFGYRQKRVAARRFDIETRNFAQFTNDDGIALPEADREQANFSWMVIARTDEGRLGYLGYTNVWHGQMYDPEYNAVRSFFISDRPVYRPAQTAHYKFWVRHARYDMGDVSDFAGEKFRVEVYSPRGEKVVTKQVTTDEYGGIEESYDLEEDASLGSYHVVLKEPNNERQIGNGTFRVEEYKKPEFEVSVEAPSEPVMLGEKITAQVKANYYFGSPVTEAEVHYKVMRTSYNEQWFPIWRWDWLYGKGAWWFGYNYDWYPGWAQWGCRAPWPFWWPQRQTPPEVVADATTQVGEDGTIDIEIDTALAQQIHGDQDHRYEITAEVTDRSRRTIVGTGSVIVAREPFKVTAWTERGHYRVGDTVRAHFKARRLDGKDVEGEGKLELIKISYDAEGKPSEAVVETWDVNTDATGSAVQQLQAGSSGQFRLSYTVTDAKGHQVEGGYIFNVIGEDFDGAEYRFNAIELVPDMKEYAPGAKAKLMVNTNRVGGTVLLFERPVNGVYRQPKVIRLEGKSTVEEIEIDKRDMPNFFVEALTVSGGDVHTEVKQIAVPPEKRVLNVAVTASAETYKPGEQATVQVKLTDMLGNPFVGTTVLSIYDKAVEYISGGSNVGDIKEFFWKWRRNHYPRTETNLERYFGNLLKQNETSMQNVGVFGHLTAPDAWGEARNGAGREPQRTAQQGFGGGGGLAKRAEAKGLADAADTDSVALGAAAPGNMDKANRKAATDAGGGGALVEATVRKEFADTALWRGSLTTDEEGFAEVSLEMPENLTTWKVKAWALGHGTKVGSGETEVITRKNLILRMQTPRFATQKDEVVLTANVHNYLDEDKDVRVLMELEGPCLASMGRPVTEVRVAAGGEARVDWRVQVVQEGTAIVRMKALTDEESDAMEMRFPVIVHGMLKTEALAGTIRPEEDGEIFNVTVPAERRISLTRLEVRYSPTVAGAIVDAVPYLVNYPHRTTEATLNRFLPTVIAQNVIQELGVDLAVVRDKRTNLNPQEIGDPQQRAEGWKRYDINPVFDEAEVGRMAEAGLEKLTQMQLSDGGWGWFTGYYERSTPHMTALVVHGLQVAQENDLAIVPGVLERGVKWLERYQEQQVQLLKNAKDKEKHKRWKEHADATDALVFMVLVDAAVHNREMLDFLYRDRVELPVYAKAMYGLALYKLQEADKLAMILRNIEQFLETDDENQTAWLRVPVEGWWYWYNNEIEADAYYLRLLARTNPKSPVAAGLVKYLVNNRKHATYWDSTRDTAICIESIAEYMRASGENKPDMTVQVLVDGQKQKEVRITPENLFTFDDRMVMVGDAVPAGVREIEIKKLGKGPLYCNVYLTNFTLEDPITKAGLEIKVRRKYYRLVRDDKQIKVAGSRGQAVDQRVEKYRREPLANLETLKSGELVEIELEIDSKNDYEYLVFEDLKAAGLEPVDVRSGYVSDSLRAYRELRDEKVVFYVRQLLRGKHSVSYRMRAEIPGRFSALPTVGYGMYAPELRANSDEMKVIVED